MSDLMKPEDLADHFGLTVEKVHDLRKRKHWPYLEIGRGNYRFTPEQVREIEAMHTVATKPTTTPATVRIPGQTARSAARRRAS